MGAIHVNNNFNPEAEISNWKPDFITVKIFVKNEQQNVFFIKKLPGVNVRNKEFHVKSGWSFRKDYSKTRSIKLEPSIYNSEDFHE